ncbi:MAG TPA: DUF1801 domain-containing protein [Planctomycetota bacterium]|nr:DUF1801 domain-containing protein [Planctomycetota bacterium]
MKPAARKRGSKSDEQAREGPAAVEAYLARQSPSVRAALERLRRQIRDAAPQATEAISYRMPTFRLHGGLVAFAAQANHCSLYLMSVSAAAAHAGDLVGLDASGATVRFRPEHPLPAALVKRLVRTRVRENAAAARAKPAAKGGRSGRDRWVSG